MSKHFSTNSKKETNGEYAEFYDTTFAALPKDVIEALQHPLDWGTLYDIENMTKLEDVGYMDIETGFATHKDGSIAIAVKTDMPGVTPKMWDWWFGWHGSQNNRYQLWHPKAHISARWQDGHKHTCYIGRNSLIKEYIGKNMLDGLIQFKSPIDFGFSHHTINNKEEAVYICAKIGHPYLPVDYGYLIHQVRKTEKGAEMRSRFWLGGKYISLRKDGKMNTALINVLRLVKSMPKNFAPDLLQHCSEEMNHLAAFLPKLYQIYNHSGELNINGSIHTKEQPNFESTMFSFLYNQQKFNRIPDMITEPNTVEDIINIIKFAKQNGKKLTVLSGGRSFSAHSMRNNCIVISLKNFYNFSINKDNMTAIAEPGVGGSTLMKVLYKNDLFFPAGHCEGVCLGGYLLQGGYGWNGRKLGIACKSIIAMDIITASGELVHANEQENADLFWAARGSGAGFFGVVIKFYLQLYPLPKYRAIIAHDFSIKHLEDVYRWAYDIGPEVPKSVEFQMLMNKNMMNILGPGIEAFAPIFADTREEFEEAKKFMEQSPIKKKAIITTPAFNPGINIFYKATMTHYPKDYRYGVDNMWTHADIDELLPFIKEIAKTLPPAPSHFLWLNWYPDAIDTDMAYSKEDNIYLALYSCWKNDRDTAKYHHWASDMVGKMQHLSSGIQLADEGLHMRTDAFMCDEHFSRVQQIRTLRDPERLFMEWHSAPDKAIALS